MNKNPIQVSFIMPVFNVRLGWVQSAVNSVAAVGAAIELIIVDDGSTDSELVAFLSQLPMHDTRFVYVRQENGGVARARNAGLGVARGEWVSFIDPDDRVYHEERVTSELEHLDVDLVVAGAIGFPASGGPATEVYSLRTLDGATRASELLEDLVSIYPRGRVSSSFVLGVPWAKFIRRAFLTRHQLRFNESIVKRSDAEWMLRLLSASPSVVLIDSPVVSYRLDVQGSISKRYRPEIIDGYLQIMRTVSSISELSEEKRQLYTVELAKDAINTVFANPATPRAARSRRAYTAFREHSRISLPLLRLGALAGASIPRKALYLFIHQEWYFPVRLLRYSKELLKIGASFFRHARRV